MQNPHGKNTTKNPIGVFDSGIGGLTVLREITRLLPNENTIYLGDTARVPYGSKSRETVQRYSLEVSAFLAARGIKMLVAACNTASAYALKELEGAFPLPVIGVIEPGAKAAVKSTSGNRIGVIGTEGTIRSNAYTDAIKAVSPSISTFTKACPLFVPLVEEGWSDDEVAGIIAARYLDGLKAEHIDTLVLGCTHYPLLKETIARVMGGGVSLIDSAEATAEEVKSVLTARALLNAGKEPGRHRFFVTDSPERFLTVGRRFFGEGLDKASLANLDAPPPNKHSNIKAG